MMAISTEQRLELMFRLAQHTSWSEFTSEQVQVGIDNAHTFVALEFGAFVRNGFRVQVGDFFRTVEDVAIQIPALPRPTLAELRAKFPWIKEENGIERDTSPECAVTLSLGTVLRPDEEQVNGTEYERRIAPKLSSLFGYQHLEWLVAHQDEHPAFKALLGKIYIDGPGIVVVGEDGGRVVPCLVRDGGRWGLYWSWLGRGVYRYERLAFSSK